MWGFSIAHGLRWLSFALLISLCQQEVRCKPLPEEKSADGGGGTVTQTGEPSHFQVDDRAAEIEVNANPAGVKVNAKPASLQVVAKPGTPAVPIFHPSVHLAPHYSAPPLIHHHPASFYHGGFPWFYGGLKRNSLPASEQSGRHETRSHKSVIPHSKGKEGKSHKRQFIQAAPQLLQPAQLGAFLGMDPSSALGLGPQVSPGPSLLSGLGSLAPYSPLYQYGASVPTQAPLSAQEALQESALSRNLIPVQPQQSAYPSTLLSPAASRDYTGLSSNFGALQDQLYASLLSQQALRSYGSGLMRSGQVPGYARARVPYAPLSQMYPDLLSQPNQGMPVYGQPSSRSMLSLLGLQPLSSGPRVYGRSKVPGSKARKKPKRSLDEAAPNSRTRKPFKRQLLLQPADDLEGAMQQDFPADDLMKRQLIMNPQLQALANQQKLQDILAQRAALRGIVSQRPFQVAPSLLQQFAASSLPQALTFNPLQSPLAVLTSNYVSPLESAPGPQVMSPRRPSRPFAASPFTRQLFPNRLAEQQPSLDTLGISQLVRPQEGMEPSYHSPLSFHRRPFGRPLYRRRLARPHYHEEEEESDLPEDDGPIGEESVSQGDGYTQEELPDNTGKTLLDTSRVGFGPITVEARTAEGQRLATDDRRRAHVQRPKGAGKSRTTH